MTEAAPQIASNRLAADPSQARFGRAGGRAGGRRHGRRGDGCCPPASTGEVVVRGENVTSPATTMTPTPTPIAFRTGGFAPAIWATSTPTGHLFITGRLKDVINRGGEKVSPRHGR